MENCGTANFDFGCEFDQKLTQPDLQTLIQIRFWNYITKYHHTLIIIPFNKVKIFFISVRMKIRKIRTEFKN